MTVKTITAFDVEAIEEGDPAAKPCVLCYIALAEKGLDPGKARMGLWAVTNHDDKRGLSYACDFHLAKRMREWGGA